jgi:small subunit ribosomal protein S9
MATKAETTKVEATKPAPAAKLAKYHYALGRRKTAVATVRLFESAGVSTVNDKEFSVLYPHKHELDEVVEVFKAVELKFGDFHFTAKVKGSGPKSQLEAVKLGLARAVIEMDPTFKPTLKKFGLVTRDPRMVERKKPGLHKARRAEQFSKR